METIVKYDVKKMKEDIKVKVEEQRFYIDQRKTVNRKGEYKISPSEAQWKHRANRHTLRIMYAAYGLARGKSFQQIENNHKEEVHPLEKYREQIIKLADSYLVEVPVESQE